MKVWAFALRSLRRNRRRNVATATALALGYAGLVLFGSYIARIEVFLRTTTVYLQHLGHVAIYKQGGLDQSLARPRAYSLTASEQQQILSILRADPRVALAGRYLRGMGLAGNGCRTLPFRATGVEPDVFARLVMHPDVLEVSPSFAHPLKGRALPDAADVTGAVGLSSGLAHLLGKPRIHDEVGHAVITLVPECGSPSAVDQIASDANIQLAAMTFDGSLTAIDGEIVNIFNTPSAETEDQTLVTSLDTLQRLYDTDAVTYISSFLRDHRDAEVVAADLRRQLREHGISADVFTFDDNRVNPYYVGSMAFLGSMLLFVGTLVTAVVVLGIMNSVTLTVYERTREIGTLRALGWRRSHVTGLYLREGLILAVIGTMAGTILALGVAALVNAANIRFSPPGVPGQVQLILQPRLDILFTVAAILLPLLVLVTWLVARRRVREPTADLLTATAT
ncbi:MAG: ABC transporter permease [Vicinamibacterales bacterium]